MLNDTSRGLLISFIQSIFPVIVITGIAHFSDAAIGVIMLMITNGINLAFYVFKSGQSVDNDAVNAEINRRISVGQLVRLNPTP